MNGEILKFVDFNGTMVFAAGEVLYSMTDLAKGIEWAGVGTDITDLVVLDKLYILLGDSAFYYSTADLVTFTAQTDSNFKCTLGTSLQGVSDDGVPYMYRSKNSNEVSYNSDPSNNSNAWSTADEVGYDFSDITALATLQGQLVIGKPEGLFTINSDGYVRQLLTAAVYSTSNYVDMQEWDGYLYYTLADGGFYYYDGTYQYDISPRRIAPDATGCLENVAAFYPGPEWMYMITEPVDDYARVLKGHWIIDKGGTARFVWHGSLINPLADTSIDAAFVNNGTSGPELWYGYTHDGTSGLSRLKIPVKKDSNFARALVGILYTYGLTSNQPYRTKAMLDMDLESVNLSATKYCRVFYRTSETDSWTNLGDFETSPLETQSFDVDLTGSKLWLQLYVNNPAGGMVGGTLVLPKILGYNVRARIMDTNQNQKIECYIRAADYDVQLYGDSDDKPSSRIISQIEALRVLGYPFTVWVDTLDDSMEMTFADGTPEETDIMVIDGIPERVIRLVLVETGRS